MLYAYSNVWVESESDRRENKIISVKHARILSRIRKFSADWVWNTKIQQKSANQPACVPLKLDKNVPFPTIISGVRYLLPTITTYIYIISVQLYEIFLHHTLGEQHTRRIVVSSDMCIYNTWNSSKEEKTKLYSYRHIDYKIHRTGFSRLLGLLAISLSCNILLKLDQGEV